MNAQARFGAILGLAGGFAWVVKFLAMTTAGGADGDLQPIEGILFFLGLFGSIGAGVALAGLLAARWSTVVRILLAVPLALAFFLLTFAVLDPLESAFKGSDAVVVDEGPLLIAGAFWLLVGAALLVAIRRKRSAHAPFA